MPVHCLFVLVAGGILGTTSNVCEISRRIAAIHSGEWMLRGHSIRMSESTCAGEGEPYVFFNRAPRQQARLLEDDAELAMRR
jgi:hypothetical protein